MSYPKQFVMPYLAVLRERHPREGRDEASRQRQIHP